MGIPDKKRTIQCHFNIHSKTPDLDTFNIAELEASGKIHDFHKTLPGYDPTPLVKLSCLAGELGVSEILIKDESKRFDLNAFKVLGASYAMAKVIASELNLNLKNFTFQELSLHSKKINKLTFVTATDGNHGRAVAWAADKFGCKAVVFMPEGSSKARLQAIRLLGTKASILDTNYDGAVKFAEKKAEENNWILIQDTSWQGYEDIPKYIMQGYFTLLTEIMSQEKDIRLTHVFVQAGVGSFAAAISAFLCKLSGKFKPIFVLVEPEGAPCFFKSMEAGDGKPHTVHGELKTIMAGLACGTPSQTAWKILKTNADAFAVCPDEVSRTGMRILGNPMGDDIRIISGESGAVTFGLIYYLLHDREYEDIKNKLHINSDSKILLFSTEGDTDPRHYRKIVWQSEK